MRWLITLAALAAIAGCSSGGTDSKPRATPTPQSTASFVRAISPLYPASNPDTELLHFGRTVCNGLSAGNSYDAMLEAIGGDEYASLGSQRRAATVIRAAVKYLCPANAAALPS
jgi:hypothetical protein